MAVGFTFVLLSSPITAKAGFKSHATDNQREFITVLTCPRVRYNLQLVMSVGFSSYFPFRQPAANSAGVR
jgi:hypothetical protein